MDGAVPVIAAPFNESPTRETLDRLHTVGLDLAELRIDLFQEKATEAVVECAKGFSGFPVLATIRHSREGGAWSGSEAERLDLFSALLPHVDAVDVELAADEIRDEVVRRAHAAGKTVVLSSHDFSATPSLDALRLVVSAATHAGADLVKIATLANSDSDVRVLAHLLLESRMTPLVAIAMGDHGVKSRVFFPALGSRFTFAALDRSTAPGQLPLTKMVEEMRTFYPALDERRRMRSSIQ